MVLPRYAGKVASVKGIEEADRALKEMMSKLPEISRENFQKIGNLMVEAASARTPIDTGRLVSNNKIFKITDKFMVLGNDTPYAGFVEDGTSRQMAKPFWHPVIQMFAKEYPKMFIKDYEAFMRERQRG